MAVYISKKKTDREWKSTFCLPHPLESSNSSYSIGLERPWIYYGWSAKRSEIAACFPGYFHGTSRTNAFPSLNRMNQPFSLMNDHLPPCVPLSTLMELLAGKLFSEFFNKSSFHVIGIVIFCVILQNKLHETTCKNKSIFFKQSITKWKMFPLPFFTFQSSSYNLYQYQSQRK